MSTPLLHERDLIFAAMMTSRGLGTSPTWWATHGVRDIPTGDTTHDWPVFDGMEPDAPDDCVTVYEAEPQYDGRLMVTGEAVFHWGLTVRVRGRTKPVTVRKAERIRHDFMEGNCYQQDVTLDGQQYRIVAVTKALPSRPVQETPNSRRWFVNLNCLAVILAHPLTG